MKRVRTGNGGLLLSLRGLWACRHGGPAIEFAFAAPMVIFFSLGLFEIAQMIRAQNTLQHAVEQAGRAAIVNVDVLPADLETLAAQSFVGWPINSATFSAQVEVASGADFMVIDGSYPYSVTLPMIDLQPFTLTAQTRVPLLE